MSNICSINFPCFSSFCLIKDLFKFLKKESQARLTGSSLCIFYAFKGKADSAELLQA